MSARQIEFSLSVAVCAWCKPKERGSGLGALSHGICPRHLRRLKAELHQIAPETDTRPAARLRRQHAPDARLLLLPL